MDDHVIDERAEVVSGVVLDAAMFVHSRVGPGLLESAYEAFLARELQLRGMSVRTQAEFPVTYRGLRIDIGFRLDMLVEESLVVELKCVGSLAAIHRAQLLSYLRLSGHRIGLLINFHALHLRDGIKRVIDDGEWRLP